MSKRKHKTLSLVEKYNILEKLDCGKRIIDLAKEYGVGRATIHDIRIRRDKIESYFRNTEYLISKPRKTLKSGKFPQVEDCLYEWYLQERIRSNTPITGEILQEKAKIFYKEIMNKDDFLASKGWLEKFKKRFGIRLLNVIGEAEVEDEPKPTSSSTTIIPIGHDIALEAFNIAIRWAEENDVSTDEMLTLKNMRDKAFEASFKAERKEDN